MFAVNHPDHADGNDEMSEGRDLGLLQDVVEVDAWGMWEADWRDTFVLDRDGNLVGIYNLTQHDLSDVGNQDDFMALLDEAAGL